MFFVKIESNKIVQTGSFNFEDAVCPDGFEVVTEDIYKQITNLPATFKRDKVSNEITSIKCSANSQPNVEVQTLEDRVNAIEIALAELMGV